MYFELDFYSLIHITFVTLLKQSLKEFKQMNVPRVFSSPRLLLEE